MAGSFSGNQSSVAQITEEENKNVQGTEIKAFEGIVSMKEDKLKATQDVVKKANKLRVDTENFVDSLKINELDKKLQDS